MANIIKLGSLYLDDCPADTEIVYNSGQAIRIGEAVPGKEISWVVVNNMLIADRCILTKISWDNLKANDLVFGKEVSIGGFRFTVRLLQDKTSLTSGMRLLMPSERMTPSGIGKTPIFGYKNQGK